MRAELLISLDCVADVQQNNTMSCLSVEQLTTNGVSSLNNPNVFDIVFIIMQCNTIIV